MLEDTRPYVYGDSLANLNLHETLKNAYIRQGGGVPIRLSSEDYIVHETEYQTRCATVVLIVSTLGVGHPGFDFFLRVCDDLSVRRLLVFQELQTD